MSHYVHRLVINLSVCLMFTTELAVYVSFEKSDMLIIIIEH